MTLPLTKQYGRAMARAKKENAWIEKRFGVALYLTAKRHDETCAKISELTKKVKELKKKRAAMTAAVTA